MGVINNLESIYLEVWYIRMSSVIGGLAMNKGVILVIEEGVILVIKEGVILTDLRCGGTSLMLQ